MNAPGLTRTDIVFAARRSDVTPDEKLGDR